MQVIPKLVRIDARLLVPKMQPVLQQMLRNELVADGKLLGYVPSSTLLAVSIDKLKCCSSCNVLLSGSLRLPAATCTHDIKTLTKAKPGMHIRHNAMIVLQ